MVVRELTQPSRAEWMQVTDVLNDSFWRTPLFKDFLFRGRKALSRTFIEALLLYSLKTGRVFVAEEGERRIVAVALWSLPDSPELGLGTYLRTGMWPYMLSIALRSPLAMGRIDELFAFFGNPCAGVSVPHAGVSGISAKRRGRSAGAGVHSAF